MCDGNIEIGIEKLKVLRHEGWLQKVKTQKQSFNTILALKCSSIEKSHTVHSAFFKTYLFVLKSQK